MATDMDSPNPDTGEEYPHTNTQLFNILPEENRFKLGEEISAPYNAPAPGQERPGARVRGVRPLVLRGAVADVHQPVVLDRRDSIGDGGEPAGQQLAGGQHRRDDLQPAGAARQDVEGLRRRTGPVLRHRPDPLPRLKHRFATHFVPFAQFEADAAAGDLPTSPTSSRA